MDKLKSVLRGNEDQSNVDEERGFVADALDASSLSMSTRIKGFAACFIMGILFSLLSVAMLSISLSAFVILYTFGNITALASTFFLMGPVAQMKKMFAPTRLIATILMLVFLALTLFSALYLGKRGLAIIFCIMQFCAMTWYAISYIPYARDAVKKCFGTVVN